MALGTGGNMGGGVRIRTMLPYFSVSSLCSIYVVGSQETFIS